MIQLLLKFKEVRDANQHFYGLKHSQKNNCIQNGLCEPSFKSGLYDQSFH